MENEKIQDLAAALIRKKRDELLLAAETKKKKAKRLTLLFMFFGIFSVLLGCFFAAFDVPVVLSGVEQSFKATIGLNLCYGLFGAGFASLLGSVFCFRIYREALKEVEAANAISL
jgi:uncharacterized membrane protein YfcA